MARSGKPRTPRPSGFLIVGWASIVLCAVLSFISAALATSVPSRVYLIVGGVGLVAIAIFLIVRWFVYWRRPKR